MYEHLLNLVERATQPREAGENVSSETASKTVEKLAATLEAPSASRQEVAIAKLLISLDILST